MPRKKKNWELELSGVHNRPEEFYFTFGKTTLYSDSLFKTPTVTTIRVLSAGVVEDVFEWERKNNIPKEKALEWVDLVKPITDLLDFSKKKRKELYKYYKETQQVKLETAIKAIEKAEKNLYNDEIRLFHLVEPLRNTKSIYQLALAYSKKREVGEHQLLYDLIIPLVEKLKEKGFNTRKIINIIDDLIDFFNDDSTSVGQSVMNYYKKPYFPKKIMKLIEEANKHPFQPIYSIINQYLKELQ